MNVEGKRERKEGTTCLTWNQSKISFLPGSSMTKPWIISVCFSSSHGNSVLTYRISAIKSAKGQRRKMNQNDSGNSRYERVTSYILRNAMEHLLMVVCS